MDECASGVKCRVNRSQHKCHSVSFELSLSLACSVSLARSMYLLICSVFGCRPLSRHLRPFTHPLIHSLIGRLDHLDHDDRSSSQCRHPKSLCSTPASSTTTSPRVQASRTPVGIPQPPYSRSRSFLLDFRDDRRCTKHTLKLALVCPHTHVLVAIEVGIVHDKRPEHLRTSAKESRGVLASCRVCVAWVPISRSLARRRQTHTSQSTASWLTSHYMPRERERDSRLDDAKGSWRASSSSRSGSMYARVFRHPGVQVSRRLGVVAVLRLVLP